MTDVEFWTLFFTGLGIIATLGTGVFFIWKEVRSFDIKFIAQGKASTEQGRQLNCRIDQQAKRSDALSEQLQITMVQQSLRSDKLYQMFIDLLKEGRSK